MYCPGNAITAAFAVFGSTALPTPAAPFDAVCASVPIAAPVALAPAGVVFVPVPAPARCVAASAGAVFVPVPGHPVVFLVFCSSCFPFQKMGLIRVSNLSHSSF